MATPTERHGMTETVTMTLSEFLLARIAEDEAAVAGLRSGDGDPDFFWGPDRIRAECEAKKRIVAEHEKVGYEDDEMNFIADGCYTCGIADYPCPTLLALALPYADHPDFREEWRP